jgi:ADP-ribose pyrophosphatase
MSDIRKVYEEKMVSSKLIFDGKVVHLYCDEVSLPDGKQSVREYVKHIGAVCVVPVTDEGEIVCVRQYRYAIGKAMLEIPAGKLDAPDEDRREPLCVSSARKRALPAKSLTLSEIFTRLPRYLTNVSQCIWLAVLTLERPILMTMNI